MAKVACKRAWLSGKETRILQVVQDVTHRVTYVVERVLQRPLVSGDHVRVVRVLGTHHKVTGVGIQRHGIEHGHVFLEGAEAQLNTATQKVGCRKNDLVSCESIS